VIRPTARGAWKAGLALAVVAGGLLWHVLACIESPMAFSPDGERLAFVTMEPYAGGRGANLPGAQTYRLMILAGGKDLRVLEETSAAMLTGPAWSPDGKRIAYLRIPLLTEAQREARAEATKRRQELFDQAKQVEPEPKDRPESKEVPAAIPYGQPPSGEPPPQEADFAEEGSLPPLDKQYEFFRELTANIPFPAALVVRDAADGKVVSTTQVDLLLDESDNSYPMVCLTVRPQYDPEGKWVYFCAGKVLMAVDPAAGKRRILAAPAALAALSPDGKTLAVLQEDALSLLATDGSLAVHRRWDTEHISMGGMAWLDKDTVAILRCGASGEDDARAVAIDRVRTDGTVGKPITLDLPPQEAQNTGELAVAPNGKAMVLAYEHGVFFLKSSGKVVRHWESEDEVLTQPTFSPDSKRVAFKSFWKEGDKEPERVGTIVFFSADGKELSRAEIPPVEQVDGTAEDAKSANKDEAAPVEPKSAEKEESGPGGR
jgi:dipeptidyl aminopeptidase/acylaminoacyl peptidase